MASQNAPVQLARGRLPEDESIVSSYLEFACQGADLPGLRSDDAWETMESYAEKGEKKGKEREKEKKKNIRKSDLVTIGSEYVSTRERLARESNLDPVYTCVALPKPAGPYAPLYEPIKKEEWNDSFNPHLRKTRDPQWERRPKIKCAAARKCDSDPLIAGWVIAVINTTEPVEGAASDTKEHEQEEENNHKEKEAVVDEFVENDSVEVESVEDESVYRRKSTKPQPLR
ncbi:hypothetical protein QAD02_012286 [Eretmocerus hayati]|uniref:Uncharacterized protein n=1 Tax=Eretmocerus hayati TaxID=131215 RepID=A0ACC2NZH0_9HYME|nr:hypothetical protein QAD02_012286 [Eretmocerus hayati]